MRFSILLSLLIGGFIITSVLSSTSYADWSIDLSRRTNQMRKSEMERAPAALREAAGMGAGADGIQLTDPAMVPTVDGKPAERTFLDRVIDPGEPAQDIVILNTQRGFVPNVIRVRRAGRYLVHVVNVNENNKNVSFILDGFSEHHATYFGKEKTFRLEPQKEGVYSYMSPETAAEGRIIVYSSPPMTAPQVRLPATAMNGEGK